MDVRFCSQDEIKGSVALPVFEGRKVSDALPSTLGVSAKRALDRCRFAGRIGEVVELFAPEGFGGDRVVLFGLGQENELTDCRLEEAAAAVVAQLLTGGETSVTLDLTKLSDVDPARAGLGARLAAYRFDRYRTTLEAHEKPSLKSVKIATRDPVVARKSWKRWDAVVDGVELARDVVNEPANVLTPIAYAERLQTLGKHGLEIEVLTEQQMSELGMNALLGVAQGSANPPRLVVMCWNGGAAKEKPLLFVGKGLTFDSGGLSLKPTLSMVDMKNDMGGSAAVAGLLYALAGRKAKVNAVGLVALVENMPDGKAQRPSDIVTSMSGLTIEIRDTDAEGRLVLADALWYGEQRFKPALIIDLATLTGNVIATLGHTRAGILTPDDNIAEALAKAGEASGELVWRLPIGPEYDYLIESTVADVRNVGEGPMFASSIAGAKFLRRFVTTSRWCHVDIAGTSISPGPKKKPLSPSWATGFGVRLLDQFVATGFES